VVSGICTEMTIRTLAVHVASSRYAVFDSLLSLVLLAHCTAGTWCLCECTLEGVPPGGFLGGLVTVMSFRGTERATKRRHLDGLRLLDILKPLC
jgi:hypothetical protein